MSAKEYKEGYYWVNAFDTWLIAELTDSNEWLCCGNEQMINDKIKEVGEYIGSDGNNNAYEPEVSTNTTCPYCYSYQVYIHINGVALHCTSCKLNWIEL
jgi:hypothetical protein